MTGSSSAQAKRWLRRALKSGARRVREAPEPVSRLARQAFHTVPDSLPGKDRLKGLLQAGTTPPRPAPFGGYLALENAGSTYTREEMATYLQLELGHLKQMLFAEPLPSWPATGHELDDQDAAGGRVDAYVHAVGRAYPDRSLGDGDAVCHLVVVNQYPRVGDEYGNGFVHRRVKYYLAAGIQVHVVVVAPDAEPESYVYDGVPVLVGRGAEARELLSRIDYASISSHFLNVYIWQQLRDSLGGRRWFTFMHGFESRRWVRTIRNYRSPEPLSNGIKDSLTRQRFWREVLNHPHGPERFVFVSRWWRRGSQDDLELVYPAQRTAVVHNVTDTELFQYRPKDPEQRFHLLWVRSAANLNYAPDLAVRTLEALRDTQYWPQMKVLIIGDGPHFRAFEDSFGDDDNVQVERRFASQDEIARLHRDYGVFLVPTRWDSQGVSRDEAMASGLVPVTNRVCAIPEFVDESCAVLAGSEDVHGMVRGILRIFDDPDRFQRMSQAAAQRVAEQSGPEHTVHAEMRLMGLDRSDLISHSSGRSS